MKMDPEQGKSLYNFKILETNKGSKKTPPKIKNKKKTPSNQNGSRLLSFNVKSRSQWSYVFKALKVIPNPIKSRIKSFAVMQGLNMLPPTLSGNYWKMFHQNKGIR